MILDVACGKYKTKGAIGIDIDPSSDADVIHDITKGLPFGNNKFDRVICNNILEHIFDVSSLLNHIHRICKPNAIVEIRVPHFSGCSSWNDIEHIKAFSYRFYLGKLEHKFKTVSKGLHYFTFKDRHRHKIISPIIDTIAKIFPKFCDRFLCYYIGGFQEIEIILQVIK